MVEQAPAQPQETTKQIEAWIRRVPSAVKATQRDKQASKRKVPQEKAFRLAGQHDPFRGLYALVPGLRKRRNKKTGVQKFGAKKTADDIAATFQAISNRPVDPRLKISVSKSFSLLEEGFYPKITERDFMAILSNAKVKSSPGVDGLGYNVWAKICEDPLLRKDILDGINGVVQSADLPDNWKHAIIYPLPKPDGGYRPISLLPTLSKIVESIITKRLEAECELIPT